MTTTHYLRAVATTPPEPDADDELRQNAAAWADSSARMAEAFRTQLLAGCRGRDIIRGLSDQIRANMALLDAMQLLLDKELAGSGA